VTPLSSHHLDAVAQFDEPQHRGKRQERQDNHSCGQHHDSYEPVHAAMNIEISITAMAHPATDQGHTGALMYGLSRSM
jgi:hypothetical protein